MNSATTSGGCVMVRTATVILALLPEIRAPPARAGGEAAAGGKKPSEWVKTLREAKEAKPRQAAVTALEVIGPKEPGVVPALVEALAKDPDAEVRQNVAQTLG